MLQTKQHVNVEGMSKIRILNKGGGISSRLKTAKPILIGFETEKRETNSLCWKAY